MILSINTTHNDAVEIVLKRGDGSVLAKKKFKARFKQSEKLLPAVDKLLKANKLKLSDLRSLVVENSGGSFTSLRSGVVTANALAYSLGIPVKGSKNLEARSKKKFFVVEPLYNREPEITAKKMKCG